MADIWDYNPKNQPNFMDYALKSLDIYSSFINFASCESPY